MEGVIKMLRKKCLLCLAIISLCLLSSMYTHNIYAAYSKSNETRAIEETYTKSVTKGIGTMGSVTFNARIQYNSVGNTFTLVGLNVVKDFNPLYPLVRLKSYSSSPSVGGKIDSSIKIDFTVTNVGFENDYTLYIYI